mmetsp:Transcript_24014/g.66545  ORF Transcript_24014/g.66545 Transcript_24014/m.66545 type:complete len:235 (-) Transcript_24014:614-1318(-)
MMIQHSELFYASSLRLSDSLISSIGAITKLLASTLLFHSTFFLEVLRLLSSLPLEPTESPSILKGATTVLALGKHVVTRFFISFSSGASWNIGTIATLWYIFRATPRSVQKILFSIGSVSFNRNMNMDATIMTTIFMIVKQSEAVPPIKSPETYHSRSGSSSLQSLSITQSMPALTAGGKSDAEIATPTREFVWLSKRPTATPRPLKNAIGMPQRKVSFSALLHISSVGHSAAT